MRDEGKRAAGTGLMTHSQNQVQANSFLHPSFSSSSFISTSASNSNLPLLLPLLLFCTKTPETDLLLSSGFVSSPPSHPPPHTSSHHPQAFNCPRWPVSRPQWLTRSPSRSSSHCMTSSSFWTLPVQSRPSLMLSMISKTQVRCIGCSSLTFLTRCLEFKLVLTSLC